MRKKNVEPYWCSCFFTFFVIVFIPLALSIAQSRQKVAQCIAIDRFIQCIPEKKTILRLFYSENLSESKKGLSVNSVKRIRQENVVLPEIFVRWDNEQFKHCYEIESK